MSREKLGSHSSIILKFCDEGHVWINILFAAYI